jgi:hypothetical protein
MIPTINVTVILYDQSGKPASAIIRAKLTVTEKYQGFVFGQDKQTETDENGIAVLELFPNELGSEGSEYEFTITNKSSGKTERLYAVVPNANCNLHEIAELPPYEKTGAGVILTEQIIILLNETIDAQQATQDAKDTAVSAAASAAASAGTANTKAGEADQFASDAMAAKESAEQARDAIQTEFLSGLAIAKGGTGATTTEQARQNLGLGNINNTADADKPVSTAQQEALADKLGKTEQAADSALLQGKPIGTNPGDVMAVGAFGVGVLSDMGQTTGLKEVSSTNGAIAFKSNGDRTFFLYGLGATGELRLDTYQGASLLYGTRIMIDNQTAQSMLNKKVSFQNSNDAANNVLDWYEEGTFTPFAVGGTTAGVGTYTTQQGRYTRIGNVVHFSLQITATTHTGAGELRIAGLPFVSTSTYLHSASIGYISGLLFAGQVTAAVVNGQTYIRLYENPSGGTPSAIPVSTSFLVVIRGSYQV